MTLAMTERQFTRTVIQTAKLCGWQVSHFRSARTAKGWRTPVQGDKGFPDLLLVHRETGRTIFAELKSDAGRLRPEQKKWGDVLSKRNDWRLWRPEDLDEIEALLKGERLP